MRLSALWSVPQVYTPRCTNCSLHDDGLSCHCVPPKARNYYQIIKRPIDLSVICKKLDKSNTLHYFTAQQFVDDVLLMFKNCATFNYVSLLYAPWNLHRIRDSGLKVIFTKYSTILSYKGSRGW